jgi:FkbM family methyltransferase
VLAAISAGSLLLVDKPLTITGGGNPNVWKVVLVHHMEDTTYCKELGQQLIDHGVSIVMLNADNYKAGPLYDQPIYMLIFINHAVAPLNHLYKSAFTFLWQTPGATLSAEDKRLLDKKIVTLIPADIDITALWNTPNFTAYRSFTQATTELIEYEKKSNMYKVGDSVYTGKPPDSTTPNYNDDYTFRINPEDIHMQKQLTNGQPWEKKHTALMSAYVQPNSIVLDIGSNIGTVAILLSRAAGGNCTVYGFEPYPPTHALLRRNIVDNKCKNIVPFPVCVGHEYRPVVTLTSEVNPGNTGIIQLGTKGFESRMITIDQLLSEHDHVSVMKVDIEGAEPLAFYGARKTIRRCMPVIFYERNTQKINGNVAKAMNLPDEVVNFDIVQLCRSLGYKNLYETSPENYMLVPPGRKMTTPNKVIRFRPLLRNITFPYHTTDTIRGYKLHRGSKAKWN